MKTWTKAEIIELLDRNDQAVYRGLVVIYGRQTADEQAAGSTHHQNGRGFSGADAAFGSSLAEQVLAWERLATKRYPTPLSPKQTLAARRIVRKYAGQLAEVANAVTAGTDSAAA